MNLTVQIGNLTNNPTLGKTNTSGKSVCNFSIAVNRSFGDKEADFFPVVVWGALGEVCMKYLSKGKKVSVTGRLQNKKRLIGDEIFYVTEIIAEDVEFLSPKDKEDK